MNLTEKNAVRIWIKVIVACLASAFMGGNIVVLMTMPKDAITNALFLFMIIGTGCLALITWSLKKSIIELKELR
jgi:hypothetical protein